MKIATLLAPAILLACSYAAALDFPQSGFSIPVLEAAATEAGWQPLAMMLPAANGFASNVNVQIQPYAGGLKDYQSLSEGQLKGMGMVAIKSEVRDGAYFAEYRGTVNGRQLHFYAKAIKKGSWIYLATATSLESSWMEDKAALIPVVENFKLL